MLCSSPCCVSPRRISCRALLTASRSFSDRNWLPAHPPLAAEGGRPPHPIDGVAIVTEAELVGPPARGPCGRSPPPPDGMQELDAPPQVEPRDQGGCASPGAARSRGTAHPCAPWSRYSARTPPIEPVEVSPIAAAASRRLDGGASNSSASPRYTLRLPVMRRLGGRSRKVTVPVLLVGGGNEAAAPRTLASSSPRS